MSSSTRRNTYRRFLAVGLAAIMIAVIFVPFQKASAFTVEIDFPDSEDDTIRQSSSGEPFEITIEVEAGELITVSSVTLILDNNEVSVKRTSFDGDGNRESGITNLVVGNVIEIESSSDVDDDYEYFYGYVYGYGYVSDGYSFTPNYYYSFPGSYGYIGGNSGGYTNPGDTDFLPGLLGPGTITITGNLRTADLAAGDHTLDVLIDTGAGGLSDNVLRAPQLEFSVEAASGLENVEEEVASGSTDVEIDAPGFEVNGQPAKITLKFSTATTATGNAVVTLQTPADFVASKTAAQLAALNLEDDGDDLVLTDENDDELTIAGVISDIDLSALGLAPGTEITIGLDYDDTGMSAAEEAGLRLFHFDDDTNEWEALTNDDPTVNGGDEVDVDEDIVYGTTDDFSLFAPAFSPSTGGVSSSGGTGGSGGGGSTVIVNQTFPPSYFETRPLAKVQISESRFFNAQGNTIVGGTVGQQITISASFRNFQETPQPYAIIIQIVDENGFTTDIGWEQGTLERGQGTDTSRSWTIEERGNYSVNIFVWDGVSGAPIPLSEAAQKNFSVN